MQNLISKLAICTILLFSLFLSACGGTSSSPGSNGGGGGNESITLTLTAPTQFPAGQPVPITITLTMTNTSAVNATNLLYSVPNATNYTGTDNITINPTGISGKNCTNIAAGASCSFTATIEAGANPGSFTVVATPGSSFSQKVKSIFTKTVLSSTNSISVTANLALVSIPNNTTGYQFYILPTTQTIAANADGSATAQISVFVESAALSFTSLQLVDNTGESVSATLIGNLSTTPYSTNTYQVTIPAGTTVQNIQALSNSCLVLSPGTNACSNNAQVIVVESSAGILQIQPNNFNMSSSYLSQVVIVTNVGNGTISGINFPGVSSPFGVNSNTCGTSLVAGESCSYTVTYTPGVGSGQVSDSIGYNNGIESTTTTATIPFTGTNGLPYAIITSSPASVSLNGSNLSQTITLTNTGTAAESGAPTLPILSAPLSLLSNTCTTALAAGSSCSYTIYYGSSATSAGSTTLPFGYNNGTSNQTNNVGVSWAAYTPPANTANIIVSPSSLALNANNLQESFTFTNTGSGTASSFSFPNLTAPLILESTNCTSTLAANNSCYYTVGYESSTTAGLSTLAFSYNNGTSSSQTTAGASWAVFTASTNIVISSVVLSPVGSAGNGSQNNPFYIESQTINQQMTLTYTNQGNLAASGFTITPGTLSNGYTLESNNCQNTILQASSANSCTIILNESTAMVESQNLSLDSSSFAAVWSGQSTPTSIQWQNGGTPQTSVYSNIYQGTIVNAYLSSESGVSPNPIGTIIPESTFYIYYTLSGGYPGQSLTYTPVLLPGMTASKPSCQLTSINTTTCIISVNSGSNTQSGNITFGNSGGVFPQPAVSPITVTPVAGLRVVVGTGFGLVYSNSTLIPGSYGEAITNVSLTSIAAATNGNIYVGSEGNVYGSYLGSPWTISGGGIMPNYGGALPDGGYPQAIALDSNNNVYAGTQQGTPNGDVYKSVGGIESWVQIGGGGVPDGGYVSSVVVTGNGNVYAGSQQGSPNGDVYVSAGGIGGWTQIGSGGMPDGGEVSSVAVDSNGNVYAGSQDGAPNGDVYVSLGGTGNWESVGGPGGMPDGGNVYSVAVDSNGNVYAGSQDGTTYGGDVYVSAGGTGIWQPIGGGIGMPDGGYLSSIAVASNGNVYAGTYDGSPDGDVYVSAAGIGGWTQVGGGGVPDGGYVNAITLDNLGNVYASTSYGDVYISIGGTGNWTNIVNGAVSGNSISSVAESGNGNIYASSAPGLVYVSVGGTGNWESIAGGITPDSAEIVSMVLGNNSVYAGTQADSVFVSSGGTESWQFVGGGVLPGASSSNYISWLAVAESSNGNGNVYAATNYQVVYVSVGGTESWAILGGGNVPHSNPSVNILVVGNTGTVYAGTSGGYVESSSGGGNWVSAGGGLVPCPGCGPIDKNISSLAVAANGNVFAGNQLGTVYVSVGGSASWAVVGGGPVPDGAVVHSLALDSSGNLYVATTFGNVYQSANGTGAWTLYSSYGGVYIDSMVASSGN